MLEKAGYEVEEAEDGAVGMQQLRARPTDLAIVDLLMPNMGGVETIRAVQTQFSQIKILAISGGGRIGNLDPLLLMESLGVQRTLVKPFERQELLAAVRELLMPGNDGATLG
jgi:DNA-binding response OmpR family regulator